MPSYSGPVTAVVCFQENVQLGVSDKYHRNTFHCFFLSSQQFPARVGSEVPAWRAARSNGLPVAPCFRHCVTLRMQIRGKQTNDASPETKQSDRSLTLIFNFDGCTKPYYTLVSIRVSPVSQTTWIFLFIFYNGSENAFVSWLKRETKTMHYRHLCCFFFTPIYSDG